MKFSDPFWSQFGLLGGPRSQILGLLDPSIFVGSLVEHSYQIHPLCLMTDHMEFSGPLWSQFGLLLPPGTGDLGTKLWVNLAISHYHGIFVLCIKYCAFVTNINTFFTIPYTNYTTKPRSQMLGSLEPSMFIRSLVKHSNQIHSL